jgi:hypothetical protein
MTWLDVDTLDLKYRKGQVWRVSDTCFIWDIQAGDTISVPFVVSRECNDELVVLDITDVTTEKLQECQQLWIQKQHGTFYEALAAAASPAVFTQLDTSRVQFVTSGRILLARVSDLGAQALMHLVHKNPIAAFEHILHRIQTEPTAVVPVVRDKVAVPEEPKIPEPPKPRPLDLSPYKPLALLASAPYSTLDNQTDEAVRKALPEGLKDATVQTKLFLHYAYAIASIEGYRKVLEKGLGDFIQVPSINPTVLFARGHYRDVGNSYTKAFGWADDASNLLATAKTVSWDSLPEDTDTLARIPLYESYLGTVYLWLVPKGMQGLHTSIGVYPVNFVLDIAEYPSRMQLQRDVTRRDVTYNYNIWAGAATATEPTGVGTILDYELPETVEYTILKCAYGNTTATYKGTQWANSETSGQPRWERQFTASTDLLTYTQTSDRSTDLEQFLSLVSKPVPQSYKQAMLKTQELRPTEDSPLHPNAARNGYFGYLAQDAYVYYPIQKPPTGYDQTLSAKGTLTVSGLVNGTKEVDTSSWSYNSNSTWDTDYVYATEIYSSATLSFQDTFISSLELFSDHKPTSILFKGFKDGSQ